MIAQGHLGFVSFNGEQNETTTNTTESSQIYPSYRWSLCISICGQILIVKLD